MSFTRDRITKAILAFTVASALFTLVPRQAAAASAQSSGYFEFSFGFSYNRSTYTGDNYTWNRRWGTSAGYHFNDKSEIEFAFQDSTDRNKITGYEDTTYHDQVYSLNWVLSLTDRNAALQPYLKVGVGQLNREASGSYAGGAAPPKIVDSLTGVLGAGLRIYLTKTFAIRMEGTSYLTGGSIRTFSDNFGVTIGASIYF